MDTFVAVGQAKRTLTSGRTLALLAAGAMAAAGIVHLRFAPEHVEEDWIHGVAFYVMAFGQLLLVPYLLGPSVSGRAARLGAVGNAVIVTVWAMSRTVGVPGVHGWEHEAVGVADTFCSGLELLTAGILALLLSVRPRAEKIRNYGLAPITAVLVLTAFAAVLVPGARLANSAGEHSEFESCATSMASGCGAPSDGPTLR